MVFQFSSTLVRPEGTGTWTYMDIPLDTAAVFGCKGQIKVKGTIDGQPFARSLMPDGDGGHFMVVNKTIRSKIGKSAGESVAVVLQPDDELRDILIPDDLQAALALNEAASALFEKSALSHKKKIVDHINAAQTVDARMRRIDKAVELLISDKKKTDD